ncbi:hypothetical protein [Erythrobacter sp. JK5]|uniref:hypothetical protein n=1 Tax=Erythrobacter sp. JK5 TaxID=2829500 RepID=UPI001BAB571B|nr:hypothetical protein [Erythrobacter sp. JK5]QUL37539.1 hypothetical protein KDC96_14510 [Erythrobacter sp. JK5]
MRTPHLIALLCAPIMLQGCVAAVIPVVAGAAVARTATDGRTPGDQERAVQRQQVATAAQAELSRIAAAPVPEVIVQTSPVTPDALIEADAYSELIRYSQEQAQLGLQSELPQSAVLADPSSLRETRAPCRANLPTVLIDLDPAGDLFALDSEGRASRVLAQGLDQLRGANVGIVWISGHSAGMAGDIRLALKQTGLDPESRDELLLMRYPGDRKQTRRADLAKSSCIIAIAGDTREDFDELFEYLVNPEAALALELLIGQGWFLIPPAIVANDPISETPSEQRQITR